MTDVEMILPPPAHVVSVYVDDNKVHLTYDMSWHELGDALYHALEVHAFRIPHAVELIKGELGETACDWGRETDQHLECEYDEHNKCSMVINDVRKHLSTVFDHVIDYQTDELRANPQYPNANAKRCQTISQLSKACGILNHYE